jgi:phage-related protein
MKLRVVFYRSAAGREPVQEWLAGLDRESRTVIAADIKTLQLGWPLGMPLVRSLGGGLWELRSRLRRGHARLIFLAASGTIVLLHGLVKKRSKIPREDLRLARRRAREVRPR